MHLNRISIRTSHIAALTLIGMVGVFFFLSGSDAYRDFILENQREAFAEHLRVRLSDLRREFDAESQRLAIHISSAPGLVAAMENRKPATMSRHLDIIFDRPGSVSGRTRLAQLQVLDKNMGKVASSTKGIPDSLLDQPACSSLRTQATKAQVKDRQKPVSGICLGNKNIYHLLIHPFATGSSSGYIFVATDMTPKLVGPEAVFNLPIRLTFADGSLLHRSANWPHELNGKDFLVTEQSLVLLAPVRTMLTIAVSHDIRSFNARMSNMQNAMAWIAVFITLFFILLTWLVLDKTTAKPLMTLIAHMRKVRSDKSRLGEHVVLHGNQQVAELGAAFNDMSARMKELYESLESLAFTDPLTKLPNRMLFQKKLQQAIEDARRDYKSFALFLMDIDRFKDINDTLGHQTGDMLLQQVAARLRSKLRDIDTVARMGGDEFAILLPAVTDKHATMAARMLLQSLRMPFRIDEHTLDVGASIGISLYPDHGVDSNILIQRSDVAMYAAKQANSGYAFYDSKQDQHNPTRLTLLGELRHAVEQEQFELYYQPKVNLRTSQVTGVEALVRWNHPREDLMLPDIFIPLLEQTGMIRNLTPWVLNEALRQGQILQRQGVPITISMNLSVRDLQEPYLAETFAEQLAALQVATKWLELEITESAVMTEPERALHVLTRLSATGLKLAIDDFGTGYSSLSYLKKLPVHTIKIDKSFVIGMVRDENDAAIVRTSIDLAHNLKLEVIAEGVENEETLKRLTELGCDTAQGNFISRPLSSDELSVWLKQSAWGYGEHKPKLVRLRN